MALLLSATLNAQPTMRWIWTARLRRWRGGLHFLSRSSSPCMIEMTTPRRLRTNWVTFTTKRKIGCWYVQYVNLFNVRYLSVGSAAVGKRIVILPFVSHCFPICNVFIDLRSSYHVHKILYTCSLDRKHWEAHRMLVPFCQQVTGQSIGCTENL